MEETIRDTFKHIHLLSLLFPICYAHALAHKTHTNTQMCASQWRRVMFQVMWGRCLCVWDSRREQSACLAPLSCMARQAAASHWLGTQWEPDCTHCTLPTSKTCDIHDYQTEDKMSDWSRHQIVSCFCTSSFFHHLRPCACKAHRLSGIASKYTCFFHIMNYTTVWKFSQKDSLI